jgi:hypothetical protein
LPGAATVGLSQFFPVTFRRFVTHLNVKTLRLL